MRPYMSASFLFSFQIPPAIVLGTCTHDAHTPQRTNRQLLTRAIPQKFGCLVQEPYLLFLLALLISRSTGRGYRPSCVQTTVGEFLLVRRLKEEK